MEQKSYDDGLRAAFEAGARFGVRYPEVNSWPEGEADLQYRAFRAELAGEPWDLPRWKHERAELVNANSYERCNHRHCLHLWESHCDPHCGESVGELIDEKTPPSSPPARSERQERLRRDPSGPGNDCNY